MRSASFLAAFTAIATLSCTAAHAATAADLPKRKPGHWEIVTVSSATGMTTTQACVGPDDSIASPADGNGCSEPKITPAGSEIIVDVPADLGSGRREVRAAGKHKSGLCLRKLYFRHVNTELAA